MKNNNWIFGGIGLGAIVFMSIVLWWNYRYANSLTISEKGIFGDMFGASNALFTGLSFAGLIITILMQRQEIKDTREEVRKQASILEIQRFESTFFTLVNCHHQIISDLKSNSYALKDGVKNYTYYEGRSVIAHLVSSIFNNVENEIDSFNFKFQKIYDGFGDKYLHYIKNLFQIVKIVDEHKFDDNIEINIKQKEKYISIIWAQLSDHEITLIFYNCIYEKEPSEYKKFIEKYSLMQNVKEIFIYDELKKLYSKKAFNKIVS